MSPQKISPLSPRSRLASKLALEKVVMCWDAEHKPAPQDAPFSAVYKAAPFSSTMKDVLFYWDCWCFSTLILYIVTTCVLPLVPHLISPAQVNCAISDHAALCFLSVSLVVLLIDAPAGNYDAKSDW